MDKKCVLHPAVRKVISDKFYARQGHGRNTIVSEMTLNDRVNKERLILSKRKMHRISTNIVLSYKKSKEEQHVEQ